MNAEVIVRTNTTTRFGFTDQNLLLDNAIIHGFYIATSIERTPLFYLRMVDALLRTGYITLSGYNNQQFNYRLPISILRIRWAYFGPFQENAIQFVFMRGRRINIRNSHVEFPTIKDFVIPAEGYAVPFTFFYEEYDPAKHQLNEWGELLNDKDATDFEHVK